MLVVYEAIKRRRKTRVQFGQQHRENTVCRHLPDDYARIGKRQYLEQLVGDALARQAFERLARGNDRGMTNRVEFAAPEARRKAIEAQDAQIILGNARRGVADKSDAPGGKVGKAVEPVVDRAAVGIGVKRVDREVAPRRIVAPVARKSDRCAASVGLDIVAQRRDFMMVAARDRGDRAMRDPRRDDLDVRRLQPLRHLLRQQGRRKVDVGDRQTEQRVAHRAADDLDRAAIGRQRYDDPAQPRPRAPFGIRQPRHRCQPAGIRRARLMMMPAVTPQIRRPCQSMS